MHLQVLYDFLGITQFLSFWLGIFPVYIDKKANQQKLIKTNKWCNIPTIIYAISFLIPLIIAVQIKNPITDDKVYNFNTLTKLLIFIVVATAVISIYIIYYYSYRYRYKIVFLINRLVAIERILTKFGYKFEYKFSHLLNTINSLVGMVCILIIISIEVWNIPRENLTPIPLPSLICHIFPFIIIHLCEGQFVLFNLLLYVRFKAINYLLKQLDESFINRKLSKSVNVQRSIKLYFQHALNEEELIDVCMKCHDGLSDLCLILSNIYALLIIGGCLLQFITITFAFSYCYYNIFQRPVSSFGWFLWTLLRIYEAIRKSFSAHINSKEAYYTQEWLNRLLIHAPNELIKEKLRVFQLQLEHRQLKITALDLFPIDGTLVFTIISSVSTYIILIYQFQYNNNSC